MICPATTFKPAGAPALLDAPEVMLMANIVRREGSGQGAPVTRHPAQQTWDPLRVMRDLLRWDPFGEMEPLLHSAEVGFQPRFEVSETPQAFVFAADVPGVHESDLDVAIAGNRITISGKRESVEREEGETFFAYERSYGSFSRSFTLPEGIDSDQVQAELKDGVLRLAVPKKPEVQPRKIALKKGGTPGKA
jgi:HSP20 family protein